MWDGNFSVTRHRILLQPPGSPFAGHFQSVKQEISIHQSPRMLGGNTWTIRSLLLPAVVRSCKVHRPLRQLSEMWQCLSFLDKALFFFRKKQSDLMTLVMFKKQEVVPLTVYVCYEDFYMHNHGFFS